MEAADLLHDHARRLRRSTGEPSNFCMITMGDWAAQSEKRELLHDHKQGDVITNREALNWGGGESMGLIVQARTMRTADVAINTT